MARARVCALCMHACVYVRMGMGVCRVGYWSGQRILDDWPLGQPAHTHTRARACMHATHTCMFIHICTHAAYRLPPRQTDTLAAGHSKPAARLCGDLRYDWRYGWVPSWPYQDRVCSIGPGTPKDAAIPSRPTLRAGQAMAADGWPLPSQAEGLRSAKCHGSSAVMERTRLAAKENRATQRHKGYTAIGWMG